MADSKNLNVLPGKSLVEEIRQRMQANAKTMLDKITTILVEGESLTTPNYDDLLELAKSIDRDSDIFLKVAQTRSGSNNPNEMLPLIKGPSSLTPFITGVVQTNAIKEETSKEVTVKRQRLMNESQNKLEEVMKERDQAVKEKEKLAKELKEMKELAYMAMYTTYCISLNLPVHSKGFPHQ